MDNPNLWHLRDHIFGFLNHKTVVNCRKVCKFWNEPLERTSYVKFLQEFGDRKVRYILENKKVSIHIPGWQDAVKKYGAQASIKDLQEIADSLRELVPQLQDCCPVDLIAENGYVKLMEFILTTSDDVFGKDIWDYACENLTETAKLMIENY